MRRLGGFLLLGGLILYIGTFVIGVSNAQYWYRSRVAHRGIDSFVKLDAKGSSSPAYTAFIVNHYTDPTVVTCMVHVSARYSGTDPHDTITTPPMASEQRYEYHGDLKFAGSQVSVSGDPQISCAVIG